MSVGRLIFAAEVILGCRAVRSAVYLVEQWHAATLVHPIAIEIVSGRSSSSLRGILGRAVAWCHACIWRWRWRWRWRWPTDASPPRRECGSCIVWEHQISVRSSHHPVRYRYVLFESHRISFPIAPPLFPCAQAELQTCWRRLLNRAN